MNKSEKISMLEECVNKYEVRDLNEKESEIIIRIPMKFHYLWLMKLTELTTTMREIEEWEKIDNES